jgi:predicted AlkP superfamily phosphohydrolase/phosphomutase
MTPKAIRPNAALRQAGLLKAAAGKPTDARVNVVPEGGIGLIYCNHPGEVDADRRKVKELFTGKEGVAAVLEPAEFAAQGMPVPREYPQAPDLILVAKAGYAVSGSTDGDEFVTTHTEGRVSLGSHGLLSAESKMNALCVVSGRGVRPGSQVSQSENIDVAPTIARLLGIEFAADGRALNELLTDE